MANFLDHVRRKSGLPVDFSDDEFSASTATEEEGGGHHHQQRRTLGSIVTRKQKTSLPRAIKSLAEVGPKSPGVLQRPSMNITSITAASTKADISKGSSSSLPANQLTAEDLEICQRLDEEYERALEEREIGYNARYASVRQSAVLSVFFMAAFLGLGTAFFMRQAAWTIPESMLFSIYTITTVGYGRTEMPTTPGFQAYTIFYILVGIAALTIMVAQVYQCIALEASRAQHARDKTEMARRGLDVLQRSRRRSANNSGPGGAAVDGENDPNEIIEIHHQNMPTLMDVMFRFTDQARNFFRHNEVGRGLSVVFPFASLILVGAIVVGPLEEWTFLEALYFSVVSLSTVGFGDYVPTQNASIWFCIFWLPFSIGFMSMYLGNVAAFYIRLSDGNILRIERHMRRRLQRAKDKAETERAEILQRAYRGQEVEIEAAAASLREQGGGDLERGLDKNNEKVPGTIPLSHAQSLARRKGSDGFDALPSNDGFASMDGTEVHSLFGSSLSDNGNQRRQRILENSIMSNPGNRIDGPTMQSMRDVVRTVRSNLDASKKQGSEEAAMKRSGPDMQFMSIRSTQTITTRSGPLREIRTRKPSFALRVLVQERFAEIIATDIAGYHSSIEIKETTMSIKIDSLMETADKWLVPRRARKPFRAVAFEVLYFVGEHGLITRGAEALFDLSPFEFHALFSPLVAAMGDADTMEGWLENTDVLAAADLSREGMESSGETSTKDEDGSNLDPTPEVLSLPTGSPKARMSTGMA